MWWSMPQWLSEPILQCMRNGDVACSFVWDWEDTRTGSFRLDDQETSLNRYMINFQTMTQRNTDNGRTRAIRVITVRPEDLNPTLTGQLPEAQ